MANSNNFTNQLPFKADKEDCNKPWSFGKNGSKFKCNLCGYKFKIGDIVRWVYTGGKGIPNFFTCVKCDGEDVIDRAVKQLNYAKMTMKNFNFLNKR